jgi:hypothetical protein
VIWSEVLADPGTAMFTNVAELDGPAHRDWVSATTTGLPLGSLYLKELHRADEWGGFLRISIC